MKFYFKFFYGFFMVLVLDNYNNSVIINVKNSCAA